jgi:hypothetical protein
MQIGMHGQLEGSLCGDIGDEAARWDFPHRFNHLDFVARDPLDDHHGSHQRCMAKMTTEDIAPVTSRRSAM